MEEAAKEMMEEFLKDVRKAHPDQMPIQKAIPLFVVGTQVTRKVISTFHVVVSDALKAAMRAVVDVDSVYAMRVLAMDADLNRLGAQAERHQAQRLVDEDSGKMVFGHQR